MLREERLGIEQLESDARDSGDQRRQEVTDQVATERRMQLDLLPNDLAGQVREPAELRVRLLRGPRALRGAHGAAPRGGGQDLLRPDVRGAVEPGPEPSSSTCARRSTPSTGWSSSARRARRSTPASSRSWSSSATSSPATRRTSTSCSSSWRRGWPRPRPCGTRCRPSSGPSSRAWPSRCSRTWTCAGRSTGWPRTCSRPSPTPGGRSASGSGATTRWAWARPPTPPAACATSTSSRASCARPTRRPPCPRSTSTRWRRSLGEDAAKSLDRLAKLAKQLEEAGLIDQREGRFELTPKGTRRIGQQALSDLFGQLTKDRVGNHATTWTGTGHDREETTKPYEFGDPFNLDLSRTVHNAVRRAGSGVPGAAAPRRLRGDRDRGADPVGHRAAARPVAVDAHARQLRAGQEDGHGPAHPDHVTVPPRLPGSGRVLRGGPRDRARGPAHRQLGLRLRDQPPARADPGPQDAGPPAGDQADHPGDRRRADGPHRPLRRGPRLRRRVQLPADVPRRWS